MSITRIELPAFLLSLFALVTCAEQPAGEAKASNDAVAAAPAKPAADDSPTAAGESCGDVACQSNSDCCKGYACGFDSERSHVQRYCLGQ